MQKIQINLLPATDKEKSLEIDLRQELHLMLADTMSANNRKVIGVFTKLLPKVNSAVVFSYGWNLFSVTE